jgi:hypothetical protein
MQTYDQWKFEEGCLKSRWDLPEFFRKVNITYHTKDSFKDGYFDPAKKGREFIIDCNDRILEWVPDIISS